MINKKFAVIAEGDIEVANTIIAPADFRIEGAYLVELSNDNSAQPGAYYNPGDFTAIRRMKKTTGSLK